MGQLVACHVEISEGRRPEVVDEIVAAMRDEGAQVLALALDPDQEHSRVEVAGDLATCERAALAGIAKAVEHIDMAQRAANGYGEGIGAIDSVAFIPIRAATLAECGATARRLAEQVATDLELPVYLEDESVVEPDRARLVGLTSLGYMGLQAAITDEPGWRPDHGPRRLGSAGATVIGARPLRIDLRLWLDTQRIAVAEACAQAVAEASGGLVGVAAQGQVNGERGVGCVVATVVVTGDPRLHTVVDLVRATAARHGVRVTATELGGLVPLRALVDTAAWQLQLEGFQMDQVLENRLATADPREADAGQVPMAYFSALASEAPTPGGGSVAAMAAALGAALTCMVANLTVGREKFQAVDKSMRQLRDQAGALQRRLLELMSSDSAAFEAVMGAYRLPRSTNEEADARRDAIQDALRQAIEVPLATMHQGIEVLRLARAAAEMGNATAVSDAGVAAYMAHGGIQSAALNVEINVMGLRDLDEGDGYRRSATELLREARVLVDEVDRIVRSRIAG